MHHGIPLPPGNSPRSGPPVLFVHSLGTNSYLYRDQIAPLKSRYRCIAPDCRGHGASSYNGTFTVEEVAADHKAVLDHLGIEQALAPRWGAARDGQPT